MSVHDTQMSEELHFKNFTFSPPFFPDDVKKFLCSKSAESLAFHQVALPEMCYPHSNIHQLQKADATR